MNRLVSVAVVLSFSLPSLAYSQGRPAFDPNKWNVIVAAGPFVSPEFEGATHYRVLPIPFIRASKGNYYIQTEGPGITANIFNDRNFNFGPSIQYRGERDEDVNDPIIRRFETINSSVEAGGFASYQIPLGPRGESVAAKIKILFDIGNAHNGYTVDGSVSYNKMFGQKVRASLSVSSTYADKNYNQTYFGVNITNAAISGFQPYNVGGGIKDIGATVNLNYLIDENWGILALLGYKKLLKPATDSPIIKNVGTSNQFLGTVGISYRF